MRGRLSHKSRFAHMHGSIISHNRLDTLPHRPKLHLKKMCRNWRYVMKAPPAEMSCKQAGLCLHSAFLTKTLCVDPRSTANTTIFSLYLQRRFLKDISDASVASILLTSLSSSSLPFSAHCHSSCHKTTTNCRSAERRETGGRNVLLSPAFRS